MNLGFVGLGAMGAPMSVNLIKAGFSVTGFDLRADAMATLAAEGGRPATSPRMLAAASDIVCLMVDDETAIRAVLHGPDGVLQGALGPMTLIVFSTVSPIFCRELAAELAPRGIEVIDAPVSGIASGAAAASLSIFVGAEPDSYARLGPMLHAIGGNIYHAGPVGAGQTVKIVNNLVAIGTYGVLSEGIAFAQALGLDEERILAIINNSSGESFSSRHWHEHRAMRRARDAAGIPHWKMAAKDLDLALDLARDAGHGLPLTGLMAQLVVSGR